MRDTFLLGYTMIRATNALQLRHGVIITSVVPTLATLFHWIERVYRRFIEKTDSRIEEK